jgi:hypothetical protein
MSYAVDQVIDEIEMAMRLLRTATKGIPRVGGIRMAHEKARKAMGDLAVAIEDVRSKVPTT